MSFTDDLVSYTSGFMETREGGELQQRLKLYQVFLKLYEHHRGLLDEILSLEHSGSKTLANGNLPYIQGVMLESDAHLVTNLLQGKTQILTQPQQTWIIGRDPRRVLIPIQDDRLSRCHAALKYVENRGFYLIDLGSRNGCYVNGEPVRRSRLLCDGDRIRLGSLTVLFFLCHTVRHLPNLSPEATALLENWQPCSTSAPAPAKAEASSFKAEPDNELHEGRPSSNALEDTSMFMRSSPFSSKFLI